MKKILTFFAAFIIIFTIIPTAPANEDTTETVTEIHTEALKYIQMCERETEPRHRLDSFADVYDAVKDSVVSITVTVEVTFDGRGGGEAAMLERSSAGSGIIFYENDEHVFIVTNFHVIENAVRCLVSFDGEDMVPAIFVGGDMMLDIAVIAVGKTDIIELGIGGYTVATFGDSDAVRIGDQVMAVGNALGIGKSATLGIVSMLDRQIDVEGSRFNGIQTDAAINRGNSGGPLVNMSGAVIGINAVKFSGSTVEGIGFAIPSRDFLKILVEVMDYGFVRRPFLGVSWRFSDLMEIREMESAAAHIIPEAGILVTRTVPGFAAYEMGLLAEDIIVNFNGVYIKDGDHFVEMIQGSEVGAELVLIVLRVTDDEIEYVTLTGKMSNYTVNPRF